MPGSRHPGGRYRTYAKLYRKVTEEDAVTSAALAALPSVRTEPVDPLSEAGKNSWAFDNGLYIQVCVPATVSSFDIEVYGSMRSDPGKEDRIEEFGDDRIALLAFLRDQERSAFLILENYPVGDIKIALTNIAGSGECQVFTAHTA